MTEKDVLLPQLSKRMEAIVSLVRPGERVADIGCDHGYVSIWLYNSGVSPHCIASDVKEGPIAIAQRNIDQYGASSGVETRTGDGLTVLLPGEADTAVLAGMGGKTILGILQQCPDTSAGMKLVLSPQSEVYEVRRFLAECGYRIEDERFVKEEDKYYPVIRAVRGGAEVHLNEAQTLYGPVLLEKRNETLKEYILKRRDWLRMMTGMLAAEGSDAASDRKKELAAELCIVNRALEYYD